METIESQIEALTQELRPYPEELFDSSQNTFTYYCFDGVKIRSNHSWSGWVESLFASTNKAEVEEYADCYRRLKLYQLLGEKAEKEFPINWESEEQRKIGTDYFLPGGNRNSGSVVMEGNRKTCVLGGVYFAREEDRLEALKICNITKEFQEKCAKYQLGGA